MGSIELGDATLSVGGWMKSDDLSSRRAIALRLLPKAIAPYLSQDGDASGVIPLAPNCQLSNLEAGG
jgi:hypothetical protein